MKKTIERDVSWMYFNHRILQEAQRPEVPLLEKLNFIGIYSNNLDEFFRVRVATLSRMAEEKTLRHISRLYAEYDEEFTRTVDSVFGELAENGIRLVDEDKLTDAQKSWVEAFFEDNIVGATSPIWLSKVDDLNLIADSAHYLAVRLTRCAAGKTSYAYAVLPIPTGRVGRYHRIPDDDAGNACVIALDDMLLIKSGGRYKLFTEGCDYVRVLEGKGHVKWARGEYPFSEGDILRLDSVKEYELNGKGRYVIVRK